MCLLIVKFSLYCIYAVSTVGIILIMKNFSPTSVAPANTLPSNYHFKFIVEEISNVNDKAQVSRLYNWKLHALAQRDIDP